MTAKVGYLDPVIGRCLDLGEVAAIATIQSIFRVDELSPTINADCLALWETICEWSEEGCTESIPFEDFIRRIREHNGFNHTGLLNAEIYDFDINFSYLFEHLSTTYETFRLFL